ncbi:hypothetical protein [Brytella acorum]|uniref:Uncharacterized protein n=1 Tax=Brytella acorum TaxID=2959299 RepID=A0AA35UX58_9PROT|nr:hypothetical protein [Brytella acorum]MDF3626232.1 hypothetical protein [Brytella acorum]CAI9121274.1 hypothetical protein LMG32879_002121 [Brytella acorum]
MKVVVPARRMTDTAVLRSGFPEARHRRILTLFAINISCWKEHAFARDGCVAELKPAEGCLGVEALREAVEKSMKGSIVAALSVLSNCLAAKMQFTRIRGSRLDRCGGAAIFPPSNGFFCLRNGEFLYLYEIIRFLTFF